MGARPEPPKITYARTPATLSYLPAALGTTSPSSPRGGTAPCGTNGRCSPSCLAPGAPRSRGLWGRERLSPMFSAVSRVSREQRRRKLHVAVSGAGSNTLASPRRPRSHGEARPGREWVGGLSLRAAQADACKGAGGRRAPSCQPWPAASFPARGGSLTPCTGCACWCCPDGDLGAATAAHKSLAAVQWLPLSPSSWQLRDHLNQKLLSQDESFGAVMALIQASPKPSSSKCAQPSLPLCFKTTVLNFLTSQAGLGSVRQAQALRFLCQPRAGIVVQCSLVLHARIRACMPGGTLGPCAAPAQPCAVGLGPGVPHRAHWNSAPHCTGL